METNFTNGHQLQGYQIKIYKEENVEHALSNLYSNVSLMKPFLSLKGLNQILVDYELEVKP